MRVWAARPAWRSPCCCAAQACEPGGPPCALSQPYCCSARLALCQARHAMCCSHTLLSVHSGARFLRREGMHVVHVPDVQSAAAVAARELNSLRSHHELKQSTNEVGGRLKAMRCAPCCAVSGLRGCRAREPKRQCRSASLFGSRAHRRETGGRRERSARSEATHPTHSLLTPRCSLPAGAGADGGAHSLCLQRAGGAGQHLHGGRDG